MYLIFFVKFCFCVDLDKESTEAPSTCGPWTTFSIVAGAQSQRESTRTNFNSALSQESLLCHTKVDNCRWLRNTFLQRRNIAGCWLRPWKSQRRARDESACVFRLECWCAQHSVDSCSFSSTPSTTVLRVNVRAVRSKDLEFLHSRKLCVLCSDARENT